MILCMTSKVDKFLMFCQSARIGGLIIFVHFGGGLLGLGFQHNQNGNTGFNNSLGNWLGYVSSSCGIISSI